MKKTRTVAFGNIVCALIFGAIAVYAIVASMGFKTFKNSTVDPSAFPQIMAVGLLIFSLILLVMNVLKLRSDEEEGPTLSIKDRGVRHMLMCVVVTVAYVALWDKIGFLILAPITMMVLMYMIDMRKWGVMAIVSIGLTLVVWLLFYKVLSISIPLGPLEVIYDVF